MNEPFIRKILDTIDDHICNFRDNDPKKYEIDDFWLAIASTMSDFHQVEDRIAEIKDGGTVHITEDDAYRMGLDICPCPKCGEQELGEADEIKTGWNGALSDEGTGRTIIMCSACGYILDEE